jgi:hypothetical protein
MMITHEHAMEIKHTFVECIPEQLEEGVVYISLPYATIVHRCLCGCGNEVVTPLSPTDWKVTFDGESISLNPSIGNWNFPCKSHYWIIRNRVVWAEWWSPKEIDANRRKDWSEKRKHFRSRETKLGGAPAPSMKKTERCTKKSQLWRSVLKWMLG